MIDVLLARPGKAKGAIAHANRSKVKVQQREGDSPYHGGDEQVPPHMGQPNLIQELRELAERSSCVFGVRQPDSPYRKQRDNDRRKREQQPEQTADQQVIHHPLDPWVFPGQHIVLEFIVGAISAMVNQVRHLEEMKAPREKRKQENTYAQIEGAVRMQLAMNSLVRQTESHLHHERKGDRQRGQQIAALGTGGGGQNRERRGYLHHDEQQVQLSRNRVQHVVSLVNEMPCQRIVR